MAVPGVASSFDWDDITTTTLRARSKKISDNWTGNTMLMDKIKKGGMRKPFSGGRSITKELVYKGNDTVKRYSGYQTLDITPQNILTMAEFQLKQYAVSVVMSGLEMLTNSGPNAVLDLLETRIENAERSLIEQMSTDLYADGTADGGKAIGGLQLLVSDTGQGTVGGIDSGTWTFWRNQLISFSGDSVGAASSTTITTAMNRLWQKLIRGRDKPDLIVAGNTYWRFYLESLQAIQRITREDSASAGFTTITYMDTPIVLDGGYLGDISDTRMYFLNTKYIEWNPHTDRDFVPLNPTRHSINQDAMVKLIAFAGNTSIRNRQLQGVLIA